MYRDLLTRHEATHDRNARKSKPFIRRSDRAAKACEACASAKAKCDDQKPCGRCQSKKLICGSPFDRDAADPVMINNVEPAHIPMSESMEPPPFMPDVLGPDASMIGPISDDMVYFNPMHSFLQDMDFSMAWDTDLDAFSIPHFDVQEPSPRPSNTTDTSTTRKPSPRRTLRDPSRGHCAFKRSPWLWEPEKEDYVQQQKEGLRIDEQSISQTPAFGKLRPSHRLELGTHQRDQIFSIVLAQNKDPLKVPSFPSLDLLNYLLQAHFVQDDHQFDSWIHAASFKPEDTPPELLASLIASGAGFISVPAIWQFGLAVHEVARLGINDMFEKLNANTRNLKSLQAFMLCLEVGMWSGFKRKIEISESFIQPLLTMLRRAGTFSAPADSPSLLPLDSDSTEVLEAKLNIHLFTYNVQTSVSLQTTPLVSFSELSFSLPAARDLWRAPTAEAWRQIYYSKTSMPRPLPRLSETMHCVDTLDELEEFIDIELCYSAILHGYWGQIWGYREAVRFYASSKSGGSHRLWLKSQHQELYSDLCAFTTFIYSSNHPRPYSTHLTIVLELFLMILHVSPDELQRFAGKSGEEEARRAAVTLEENWANTSESRHAVWHAGQVIANARRLPPTSLRGFNANAVYFASLTLWIYGLFCSSPPDNCEEQDQSLLQPGGPQQQQQQIQQHHQVIPGRLATPGRGSSSSPAKFVLLDGEETRDTKAFLQFDRGVPALRPSLQGGTVEPLSDPGSVLSTARDVFRGNYPVRSEPLPPLVEGLVNLLGDLGNGVAGRVSRVHSGVQSRVVSRMGSEEH
ncbi:hypothetical protein VMCG_01857 [Cytospora schulzeri]|uniref:Zn(2)-C6 fungal-type domain-containing protein n=1 Tax=Cytospora schulzeri TaxID=448051 RepID=A0A423X3A9_9PEZI|nr:hypothetical protein VMCG_01857 [Valsa malicola]